MLNFECTLEKDLLEWIRAHTAASQPMSVKTDLLETGLLDSLLIMDLTAHIERKYRIEIEPGDFSPRNFRTVEAMASLISQKLSAVAPRS